MKKGFWFLILVLISGFFVFPAQANPIALSGFDNFIISPIGILLIFVVLFLISSCLEFTVAYFFLRKFFKRILYLFQAIFLTNLITFPLTQLLGFCLLEMDFLRRVEWKIYLAEIFPLLAEYYILRLWFKKMFKCGLMLNNLSRRRIFFTTTIMNLITFILGVWLLQSL